MIKRETKAFAKPEIPVLFTDPYQFWNRSLALAFCLALTIHLAAAFIFHVQIFKMIGSEKILEPVEVIPQFINPAGVVTSFEKQNHDSIWLRKPRSIKPQVPPIILKKYEMPIQVHYHAVDSTNLFSTLEKTYDAKDAVNLDLPSNQSVNLAVCISENLRERIIQKTIDCNETLDESYLYEIMIDDRMGEIIWYQTATHSLSALEQVLMNLRFKEDWRGSITKGWIEFSQRSR